MPHRTRVELPDFQPGTDLHAEDLRAIVEAIKEMREEVAALRRDSCRSKEDLPSELIVKPSLIYVASSARSSFRTSFPFEVRTSDGKKVDCELDVPRPGLQILADTMIPERAGDYTINLRHKGKIYQAKVTVKLLPTAGQLKAFTRTSRGSEVELSLGKSSKAATVRFTTTAGESIVFVGARPKAERQLIPSNVLMEIKRAEEGYRFVSLLIESPITPGRADFEVQGGTLLSPKTVELSSDVPNTAEEVLLSWSGTAESISITGLPVIGYRRVQQ